MTVSREKEHKALLSQEKYKNLLGCLVREYPRCRPVVTIQTNHYYDTKKLELFARNSTLRVREIESLYELQLKLHNVVNGFVFTSDEYCRTDEEVPSAISGRDLPLDNDEKFLHIGSLKTVRTSMLISRDCRVDLDVNSYLGICDYEAEIEFSNEISSRLMGIVSLYADKLTPEGKYNRFIRRYREVLCHE